MIIVWSKLCPSGWIMILLAWNTYKKNIDFHFPYFCNLIKIRAFLLFLAGVSSLINLLNSAQDEDQPKLNILLCEAVVAVYLSLLIHALATNSCNELFRLAAHPLNSRMWAAVFGGGVKLVVKPRRQSENIPGMLFGFLKLYNDHMHFCNFRKRDVQILFLFYFFKSPSTLFKNEF